ATWQRRSRRRVPNLTLRTCLRLPGTALRAVRPVENPALPAGAGRAGVPGSTRLKRRGCRRGAVPRPWKPGSETRTGHGGNTHGASVHHPAADGRTSAADRRRARGRPARGRGQRRHVRGRASPRHRHTGRHRLDHRPRRRGARARRAAGAEGRRRRPDRHDLPRHAARARGGDRPAQPRRGGRPVGLLFPHRRVLRNRRAPARLAEPPDRHRHRRPQAGRAALRRVRGALTMARVGFIGLGNMGGPMAANLMKAGHELQGFDVVPSVLSRFAGGHARNAADAARGAEVVVTMLPAGEHVRDTYLGEGGLVDVLRGSGVLLIDCSTIDVATARAVAAAAADAGLAMLDAPVSGGVGGATAGTLTFMVGGDAAAFELAQPVLRNMGKTVVHAGGPGAGQAAKICNNMILGISMIAVSEAMVLADRLGLDRQKLFDIASVSSGQCWSLTNYCPAPGPVPAAPSNRDYAPGFAAALMLKDLLLSQEAAKESGAPTPLGAHAASLYRRLVEAGEGGRDFSVTYRWLSGLPREAVVQP